MIIKKKKQHTFLKKYIQSFTQRQHFKSITLRAQETAAIKPNFDSDNIKQNCDEITV